MFCKFIGSLFCVCLFCVESFADRKPGDVVVFYNVTSHSIRLAGTGDVQAKINTEIGKKAIDFSKGSSDSKNLVIISANESQAHLFSMRDNEFEGRDLLKLTDMPNSDVSMIEKKNSQIKNSDDMRNFNSAANLEENDEIKKLNDNKALDITNSGEERSKLTKLYNNSTTDIATIRKENNILKLKQRSDCKYISGLYRHSSGKYALIVAEDLKTYLEKEHEVLEDIPGMPPQWTSL